MYRSTFAYVYSSNNEFQKLSFGRKSILSNISYMTRTKGN
jgi:hypothetical protein